MKARFKRRVHVFAEKYFPEQRLYLRTERSTRYLRLSPSSQLVIVVGTGFIFGWTIFASAALMVNKFSAIGNNQQAVLRLKDYEARLKSLSVERDKRALEAQTAQERFYIALDQISAQQSALLSSEERRRELETGIEVVQRTLRKTIKARDRAETQADQILAELQAVNGNVSIYSSNSAETETTLDYLNEALDETVVERDAMVAEAGRMKQKVSDLKHQAKLDKERNDRIFSRLEEAVTVSISPLEKLFEGVGLSTDKLLDDVRKGYSGMGGPLTPLAISTMGEPEDPSSFRANQLLGELDKVNMMRIAAERLPFGIPLKSSYRQTSGYGWRKLGSSSRMHDGLDFASGVGTPVYATADGVVNFVGWAGGYGRIVKIHHSMGFETRYAHLSAFHVKKGQRVSRGDRIGDMGNTGRSTGPHVHYEVRIGGKSVNPINYIKAARNVF
ncbi:MAG: peptidoglycan DD-metalloendopeptidase family protein [Rhodobacteraceae bacterium]|nr:peptidoglycan DD-metalloendopeptidase family protein [Paracoccaceae bacterium]